MGNRCFADRARIVARTLLFEAKAPSIAILNWLIKCLLVVDSMVYHHLGQGYVSVGHGEREQADVSQYSSMFGSSTYPGMLPKPPTLAPTPSAPFRPNSTATNPNGSSREGMRANSAPLKMNGGSAVNSGLENTRSG